MIPYINIYIIGLIILIFVILSSLVEIDLSGFILSNLKKQVQEIRVKHDLQLTFQESLANVTIQSSLTHRQPQVLKKLTPKIPYVIYFLGFSYSDGFYKNNGDQVLQNFLRQIQNYCPEYLNQTKLVMDTSQTKLAKQQLTYFESVNGSLVEKLVTKADASAIITEYRWPNKHTPEFLGFKKTVPNLYWSHDPPHSTYKKILKNRGWLTAANRKIFNQNYHYLFDYTTKADFRDDFAIWNVALSDLIAMKNSINLHKIRKKSGKVLISWELGHKFF